MRTDFADKSGGDLCIKSPVLCDLALPIGRGPSPALLCMPLGPGHRGLSKGAAADELEDGTVIRMRPGVQSHLKDQVGIVAGGLRHGSCIVDGRGHRRFHVYMLAGRQGVERDLLVQVRGRGDKDRGNIRIIQYLAVVFERGHSRRRALRSPQHDVVGIHYSGKIHLGDTCQCGSYVPPLRAETDHGSLHLILEGCPARICANCRGLCKQARKRNQGAPFQEIPTAQEAAVRTVFHSGAFRLGCRCKGYSD